jgi:hypothetical protein
MRRGSPIRSIVCRASLLLGLLAVAAMLQGQILNFGRVKDFSVPDYFDPPHQNQVKSRLSGKEAEPRRGGLFVIKEIKVESFRLDGFCEFRVTAPECTYDSQGRTAYSASAVRLESGDGQLLVEGRGFLWQQTNSMIIISNDQRTVIRPLPPTGTNTNR